MKNNLFDYATKELSQDAFLRWFFENYDDPHIGPVVVDFINACNIPKGDIVAVLPIGGQIFLIYYA